MSFMGGFGQGLQNSAQAMMLKQMMLRGQQAAPGAAQAPQNPYSGPQQGGPGGYDPQAMESAMDAALGKGQQGPPEIQSSGMTPQAGTQLPPPNILAGLKAIMMGGMGGGRRPEPWDTMGQTVWGTKPDYGSPGSFDPDPFGLNGTLIQRGYRPPIQTYDVGGF